VKPERAQMAAEASSSTEPAPAEKRLVEVNPRVPFLRGPLELLRSLRTHRHLTANFIARDIRLKYRESALGYVWSLLEPLMLAAVYYFLYVVLAQNHDPRQPLWIILGVITWQCFAKTVNGVLGCLTRNEALIKQVYFPREIFALTTAGAQYVLAALSLVVAVPLMIYYGIAPTAWLLMMPFGLALACLLGLGAGLALACLNVVNRDVEHLMKFITRAGVFLSPVLWTIEMAPTSRAALVHYVQYNPMTLPITMVRDGVAGNAPPLGVLPVVTAVAVPVLVFFAGAAIFKRYEAQVIKKL
jgi:ABC-type polysaccharide/polyol phosphate export permease